MFITTSCKIRIRISSIAAYRDYEVMFNNGTKIKVDSTSEELDKLIEETSSLDSATAISDWKDVSLKEKLAIELKELNLSNRTSFRLCGRMKTIGDLVSHTASEIRLINGIGELSMGEINSKLNRLGLRLGMINKPTEKTKTENEVE